MKKRRRVRKWVWVVLIFIFVGILIYSLIHIFSWHEDNKKTKEQIDEIDNITNIEEVPASDADELVNPPEEKDTSNDYWDYISLPLINVDFTELMKKNSDTVAFIRLNNTNINYPVVQTNDNSYYLTHSYNKANNQAGWVFLGYRNDINNLQDNTIIYAHGRMDKTMFGTLKNIFKNKWYETTDEHVVYLSTPQENTLWQVFSVYIIPTETYYITTSFGSEESHQKFIDTILSRSKYDFKTSVNTDDKILTLSTCYDDNRKVVLHAKLIKRQAR